MDLEFCKGYSFQLSIINYRLPKRIMIISAKQIAFTKAKNLLLAEVVSIIAIKFLLI